MMKRSSTFLAAVLFLFTTQLLAQEVPSAERVLQKAADNLAAVKLLGYKYSFEYRYPSQGRSTEVHAEAFIDLKPTDGISQFRFQFSAPDSFDAYNGTERFILDKKGKKIYVQSDPSFKSFGNIFLQNSPLSLKYALPRIIADAAIQKKVSSVRSGDRDQYLIEFSLPKGILNSAGEIVEIRPDHTNLYRLKVDKATYLPVEVLQSNDKNDEVLKTTYAEITEKPASPTALSWYFSTYLNEYALQRKDKLTLIDAGKTAPDFSLSSFDTSSKISLEQYKGKLILLEFWITHCGFCIAAVPKLNAISERFREKDVQVVSINMYDPAVTIELFKKKHKPEYTILTGGESIAAAYGVEAYPAIVLVGKDGKVVYSASGLFEKEPEAAIATHLQ